MRRIPQRRKDSDPSKTKDRVVADYRGQLDDLHAKWEKCCLGIVAKRLLVCSLRKVFKQIVAHLKLRLSYTCHYFLCLKAGASHIALLSSSLAD